MTHVRTLSKAFRTNGPLENSMGNRDFGLMAEQHFAGRLERQKLITKIFSIKNVGVECSVPYNLY